MTSDACAALVALAERLGAEQHRPAPFLRALAREGAGIRTGPLALLDLARGGRNPIRGGGFRAEYADGSGLQVRHFCGVARAVALVGPGPARWLLERSGDAPTSHDGRLTEAAVRFERGLRSGRIAVPDAGSWIRAELCSG